MTTKQVRSAYRAARLKTIIEKLVLFLSGPLTMAKSTRQILIAGFQT